MNNIEEDIKRCKKLTEPQNANWIGISNQLAVAHVVDRVKEVENDLTTVYLKGYADAEEKYRKKIKEGEVTKEFLPKQKIKDKIDEINKAYEESKNEYGESEYYYPDYTITILEELIEESEDK